MTSHTASSRFTQTLFTALVASAIGLTATLAHAETAADVPSASVSYADLNLSTEQGSRVLHQRLVAAARQVCPSNVGPDARQLSQSRRCVASAVERAINDVRDPKLAATRSVLTR